MKWSRRIGLLIALLSGAFSIWLGFSLGSRVIGGPIDFQAIYYGARCLIEHHNPYSATELDSVYRAENNEAAPNTLHEFKDAEQRRQTVTLYVNLPTTFLLFAPFAVMPLATAQAVWMILSGAMFILAASLMWNAGSRYSPVLTSLLICFLASNDELAFATGNSAALIVPLCVIAAWCFLKNRWVAIGIVCMAFSLAVKPHDAGFIWLYFLLSGAVNRRRALLSLLVTIGLAIPASIWLFLVAPGWVSDWRANLVLIGVRGGLNDPSPASIAANSLGQVISLQSVISVFRDDPRVYNLGAYVFCGVLLIIWLVTTLRSNPSSQRPWFALASIVPLTMLITYHRIYDAKLMLLAIPACAILWARGGVLRWCGLIVSTLGIFFVSDIPLALLVRHAPAYSRAMSSFGGQLITVFIGRPTTLALLITSIFYLSVYVKRFAFEPRTAMGERKQTDKPEQYLETAL